MPRLEELRQFAADTPPGIAADFLCECTDATLPDVLRLYAGEPPGWDQAWLPQEALWRWLQQTEPKRFCAEADIPWDWRWEAVRGLTPDVDLFSRTISSDHEAITIANHQALMLSWHGRVTVVRPDQRLKGVEARAQAVCLRDQKRRTLCLFPEVEYRRRYEVPTDDIREQDDVERLVKAVEERLRAQGWYMQGDRLPRRGFGLWPLPELTIRHDDAPQRIVWTQTLYAPDLIPPEPEPPLRDYQQSAVDEIVRNMTVPANLLRGRHDD